MNQAHIDFLSSPQWTKMLREDLLPWLDAAGDLGDDVLEIGPGPGLTTDLLRTRIAHLTAVEIDPALAGPLRERLDGTNVEVVEGDAATCGFDSNRFSAVTCFSVLHHMPSPAHQNGVFAELGRVLAPDGLFVGTDSLDNELTRGGHEDDTFTPVDPGTLSTRLERAGLTLTHLDQGEYQFRFVATKGVGRYEPDGCPSRLESGYIDRPCPRSPGRGASLRHDRGSPLLRSQPLPGLTDGSRGRSSWRHLSAVRTRTRALTGPLELA